MFNLGFDFASPFLPLYVLQLGVTSLQDAAVWSGVLIGVSPILATLTGPFWGDIADRYGIKLLLLRALIVFGALVGMMGLATNVWQLLGLRAVLGLMGGFSPLATGLMVSIAPRERTGQALGMVQVAQFAPLMVAPAIGGVLADTWGLRNNFFLAAALCGVGAALLAFGLRNPPRPPARATESSPRPSLSLPRLGLVLPARHLALPLVVLFAAQFVDRSFYPVVPLYVSVLAQTSENVATTAGLILAVGAGASMISSALTGYLADRYDVRRLIGGGLIAGALLLVPIALVAAPWHVLVLRGGLGLLTGGLPTLAYALGSRQSLPGSVGRSVGTMSRGAFLAQAIAPVTAGLVANSEIRAVFLVDASLFVVTLLAIARIRQRG
jgi:MFS family permease